MANKKQRIKNRLTSLWLREQHVCPRCKEKGRHAKMLPYSVQDRIQGYSPTIIWTCPKFADEQLDRAG